MNPKEYYYNCFREQFNEFARKANTHQHHGDGIYLSIQDLRQENLAHIPYENYVLFYCALACTVLIDQLMYTYFKKDYLKFQEMTLYPKIEYGISNINVLPWDITRDRINLATLKSFLEFFVEDLKEFFEESKFEQATWEKVKEAMLSDHDVVSGSRGELFKNILMK